MILYIDTTDFKKATFAFGDGKKVVKKSFNVDPHESHRTLQKLEGFLKSNSIKVSGSEPALSVRRRRTSPPKGERDKVLRSILVNKGPGSFTGTRVGVTIAMALGFAWGIPMKAVASDKFKL